MTKKRVPGSVYCFETKNKKKKKKKMVLQPDDVAAAAAAAASSCSSFPVAEPCGFTFEPGGSELS